MSSLIGCFPGDRTLDLLLITALGVALVSSAAWLIARPLAGKAALRHLVLFSALIGCVACPAVAWFCAGAGLTLVSMPFLHGQQGGMASPKWMPPRPSTGPPPVTEGWPSPHSHSHTHRTADLFANLAACCDTAQRPAMLAPLRLESRPSGGPATPLPPVRGIANVGMFVWAVGAVLMLARLARNCGRVAWLRRSSRPARDECLQTLLRTVASQPGTRRVPLLLVSSRAVSPLAVGFGRPAIILPDRLLGEVNDNELRDVLVHELAHLKRGDPWIVLMQALAGALFWPIVPVHGLNRELQRAREEVCDNAVLTSRDAIRYGETLLHVAELLVEARPMSPAVAILGGRGELERRIAGLLDPGRSTTTTTGRTTAGVVMLLFLLIAAGAIASSARFAASIEPGAAGETTRLSIRDGNRNGNGDGDPFATFCCPS